MVQWLKHRFLKLKISGLNLDYIAFFPFLFFPFSFSSFPSYIFLSPSPSPSPSPFPFFLFPFSLQILTCQMFKKKHLKICGLNREQSDIFTQNFCYILKKKSFKFMRMLSIRLQKESNSLPGHPHYNCHCSCKLHLKREYLCSLHLSFHKTSHPRKN